jgi:arsenate reductase
MNDEFPITIYHNPGCGTSRNVVAIVNAAGYTPKVVEYLQTGWTLQLLQDLIIAMDMTPQTLLREKGTLASELGLMDADAKGDRILREMVAHPVLVNRPIVVTPKGVKLCRPSDVVLTLLDRKPDAFAKEDGEVVRL